MLHEMLKGIPILAFELKVGSVFGIANFTDVNTEKIGEGILVEIVFEPENVIVVGNDDVLGVSAEEEEAEEEEEEEEGEDVDGKNILVESKTEKNGPRPTVHLYFTVIRRGTATSGTISCGSISVSLSVRLTFCPLMPF